jgi:hypothetical protein
MQGESRGGRRRLAMRAFGNASGVKAVENAHLDGIWKVSPFKCGVQGFSNR